ncbi:hypothetical protein CsSME_00011644 [Camellia sinensis var. sinensis]
MFNSSPPVFERANRRQSYINFFVERLILSHCFIFDHKPISLTFLCLSFLFFFSFFFFLAR